jgi:hypothetical protein
LSKQARQMSWQDKVARLERLNQLRARYRSMLIEDLDQLFLEKNDEMSDEERQAIYEVRREKKGINPVYGHGVRVCPSCLRVEDDCICSDRRAYRG